MGGKHDKAVDRLKSLPKDYTFTEARSLMKHLGYEEYQKGTTSGSRVRFVKNSSHIDLHKPHPGDIMKFYMVKQLRDYLIEQGDI